MFLDWLGRVFGSKRSRRRRLLAQPMPTAWRAVLERLPFFAHLDMAAQHKLCDDLRVLIAEKEWEGCGGLELTDEIKVVIAAQACLLVLRIEHDFFPDVQSILVYPSAYFTQSGRDAIGIVRERQANLGEAWQRGPVVLAWDAALQGARDERDGHNLVFHEFAHKLDMLDGSSDGTPPLRDRAAVREWAQVMTREFKALRSAARNGRVTVLDDYGATNPAEFFAVATECFFEKGLELRDRHAQLYDLMRDYYGQDPAARRETH